MSTKDRAVSSPRRSLSDTALQASFRISSTGDWKAVRKVSNPGEKKIKKA